MEFDPSSREFTRQKLPDFRIRPGELLVKVLCCTICGSDLHTFCGRRNALKRCILGHEIIGSIAGWCNGEVPRDFHGNELRLDQRVTWVMAVGCGVCFYCRKGLNQKCESLFKYGHEPNGHHILNGGLSTHCILVPGTSLFAIPDELSDEVACPANCATATVSAAVRTIAQTHPLVGATVLITGSGMLGLTAAAQLSDIGARHIVVADPNSERLEYTKSFGVTHTICATSSDEIQAVLFSITEGRGADMALDFAGVSDAVKTCLASIRIGGCVLLAGSVFPGADIPLSPEQIVRRMLTIRGLHNYLPKDLDHALDFLRRVHGRFPFDELVSKTFALEQTQRAFEYANQYQPVRVAVKPE